MIKVSITCGSTYAGCPSETIVCEYDGTEDEFYMDHEASTDILNMIFNNEFPHFYMDLDIEEVEDEDDD